MQASLARQICISTQNSTRVEHWKSATPVPVRQKTGPGPGPPEKRIKRCTRQTRSVLPLSLKASFICYAKRLIIYLKGRFRLAAKTKQLKRILLTGPPAEWRVMGCRHSQSQSPLRLISWHLRLIAVPQAEDIELQPGVPIRMHDWQSSGGDSTCRCWYIDANAFRRSDKLDTHLRVLSGSTGRNWRWEEYLYHTNIRKRNMLKPS